MKTPIRTMRLSDEDWRTFRSELGLPWLRNQIAKARKRAARKITPSE